MKKETFFTSISIDVFQLQEGKNTWERTKVFYDLLNLDKQQIQGIIKMIRLYGKDAGSLHLV